MTRPRAVVGSLAGLGLVGTFADLRDVVLNDGFFVLTTFFARSLLAVRRRRRSFLIQGRLLHNSVEVVVTQFL